MVDSTSQPGDSDQTDVTMQSFAYAAQDAHGRVVRGTIEAVTPSVARQELERVGFQVVEFDAQPKAPRGKSLRGDDFVAFNQQLAQMTKAGLPIERGLRLIARDMRQGGLSETVDAIADELEKGVPLADAFDKHRGQFPSMYGSLIEAGVKSGNLPGMLLSLGRHLDMVSRLRGALWRAASYPCLLLVALAAVIVFLGLFVLPGFVTIFEEFDTELPSLTLFIIDAGAWMPWAALGVIAFILALPLVAGFLRSTGKDQSFVDRFLIPIPLIGPVLYHNRCARWCDALQIAVTAGLDLPKAINLAGEAVGSPDLQRDGRLLIDWLEQGQNLRAFAPPRAIPATVIAAIELTASHRDLPHALATITNMYEEQADIRISAVQLLATPVLLITMSTLVGFVVAALFLPLAKLIQSVSGG